MWHGSIRKENCISLLLSIFSLTLLKQINQLQHNTKPKDATSPLLYSTNRIKPSKMDQLTLKSASPSLSRNVLTTLLVAIVFSASTASVASLAHQYYTFILLIPLLLFARQGSYIVQEHNFTFLRAISRGILDLKAQALVRMRQIVACLTTRYRDLDYRMRKKLFDEFAFFILGGGHRVILMLFWPGWWVLVLAWAAYRFCG